MLLKGNCLETLKTLDTASVDSIVTDPPYELGFMGKSWDNSGIAYNQDLWAECLRVLKPGGHLLAFSGSRTYHRMVVAIEDSGFEIRDQIMWLYGSGFPKSLDVSKAIDKAAGAEREVVGQKITGRALGGSNWKDGVAGGQEQVSVTAPTTPEAQQWQGWGTALKPAHEPIVVARKPLIGTVANNVLTYGTGALNIDGSRVNSGDEAVATFLQKGNKSANGIYGNGLNGSKSIGAVTNYGRWPANVIHDGSDEVLAGFPNEAARFFYCAKASKSERDAGLGELPKQEQQGSYKFRTDGSLDGKETEPKANIHPTVKPLALMRYLIKLVTPPNGVVLDPFLGSGTTAVAATLEGFDWIGCEMTEDYFPIIEARVEWAQNEHAKTLF